MKKQYLVIGVIVVAAFIAVLFLRGSFIDRTTVVSGDGSVLLVVPDNVLPEGIEGSTLTIDVLEVEIAPLDQNDFVTRKEIVLGPSGTTFSEPVEIAITTEYVPNSSPVIFHIFDDKTFKILESIVEEIDEEKNTVTYSTEITHFSRIDFFLYRTFVVIMDHPGDQFVGDSFEVTASIRKHNLVRESTDSEGYRSIISVIDDSITIVDGTFVAFGPITPDRIGGNPSRAEMNIDDYRVNQTLTCTGAGKVSLIYNVNLFWEILIDTQNIVWGILDVETQINRREAGHVTLEFNCIDPTVLDEPPKLREGSDVELLQKTNDDEAKYVVLLIDDSYYPAKQFVIKNATEPESGHTCLDDRGAHALHYHPRLEVIGEAYGLDSLDSLDVVIAPDPNPEGCGFGLNDDIERLNVSLTAEQQRVLLRWMDSL